MQKNEILKSAFAEASKKEWSVQSDAPFEMSDNFRAKMNEIISSPLSNDSLASKRSRLNASYIRRLLVAAVVMMFFTAVSVITVWGVDEYYTFMVSDTLYGLKLENRIERSYGSINTDSDKPSEMDSDTAADTVISADDSDENWAPIYDSSTDNECIENGYDMEVCSDNDSLDGYTDIEDTCPKTDDSATENNYYPQSAYDIGLPQYENIAAKFAPKFPSGYNRTYIYSNNDVFMMTYENENDKIEFSQRILDIDEYIPEPENTFIDTYVHGKKGTKYQIIVRPDGNTTILWGKYGYSFIMSSSNTDYHDLIDIAETLDVFKG